MASPTSVHARVSVADVEIDVLFLIVQYLRDLGLYTTVVALLRESGIDPFWLCGPSREIALLREWVFQGEWRQVRAFLGPLAGVLGGHGLAAAVACVDKQELLEEFHISSTSAQRRREIVDSLQGPKRHSAARLTKHELHRCLSLLKENASRCAAWSLDEARLRCFESLVPLFRDAIGAEDEEGKYVTMPQRQLVALLNDALALHQEQGDEQDLIAVKPISMDICGTEPDTASLRLAEPVKETYKASNSDALSQSVDLSYFKTGQNLINATTAIKTNPSRNPLVMSMMLSESRRHNIQRFAAQSSEDHEIDISSGRDEEKTFWDEAVDSIVDTRTFDEAETQTDFILTVDQAIEALEPPLPSFNIMERQNLSDCEEKVEQSDSGNDEEVVGHEAIESSNQDTDIPASVTMSRSTKAEMVSVNAPLEAWCTSRRGELPEDTRGPKESIFFGKDELLVSAQHDNWAEQPVDGDNPTAYDSDEDPELRDDTHTQTLLCSYADLTIDSVVRAHIVAEVREAQAIRAMDIAPDGSEMVIGTNARALRIFDLAEPLTSSSLSNSGGLLFLPLLPVSLERHKHHSSSIYTACYNHISPTHAVSLIATGSADSSIKVFSRWTQQEMCIQGHSGKSRALCFASSNILCSAASGDLVIRAWDLNNSTSKDIPCVQRFDGHVGEIQAMTITATSDSVGRRFFVTSSMDRTVRLWDLRSAQCAGVLTRTTSPAYSLSFRPDINGSSVLASGHEDGSIALWDLRKTHARGGNSITTMSHHQDECRAISWSPDGQWLLSASFDCTLCLMEANGSDVNAVASFHQHHDKILQAQWHPTQPAIVTTGADKLVKLWGFI